MDMHLEREAGTGWTRREFMEATGALGVLPAAAEAAPVADGAATASTAVAITVNGRPVAATVDNRTSLLDFIRHHAGLTGTKKGCDQGQCGACTVLVDGQRVNACLSLAVMHDGESVVTVEGLGRPDRLHPLQAAFVRRDAFQCGFCTCGQICSAVGMLSEARAGVPSVVTPDLRRPGPLTADEIRERMSGNLCRCAAYVNIVAAIQDVAGGGDAVL